MNGEPIARENSGSAIQWADCLRSGIRLPLVLCSGCAASSKRRESLA
jgi:hypothetical protein